MTLLLVHSFSWIAVAATGIIAFGLGFLFKSAIVIKQRKRILRLEDEMLANHANILTLEKKLVDAQKEKNVDKQNYEMPTLKSDRELRAS